MNSKRDKNVRKACDEISDFIENHSYITESDRYYIKSLTHRIKRTTWRGENKSQWDKDWNNYNNAKRINTNTTSTANIDVSTIPYY